LGLPPTHDEEEEEEEEACEVVQIREQDDARRLNEGRPKSAGKRQFRQRYCYETFVP
jgi:hypothetical protein